jgi:hypothetical protein
MATIFSGRWLRQILIAGVEVRSRVFTRGSEHSRIVGLRGAEKAGVWIGSTKVAVKGFVMGKGLGRQKLGWVRLRRKVGRRRGPLQFKRHRKIRNPLHHIGRRIHSVSAEGRVWKTGIICKWIGHMVWKTIGRHKYGMHVLPKNQSLEKDIKKAETRHTVLTESPGARRRSSRDMMNGVGCEMGK